VDVTTLKLVDKKGNLISTPGRYELLFTNGAEERIIASIELVGPEIILEEWKH